MCEQVNGSVAMITSLNSMCRVVLTYAGGERIAFLFTVKQLDAKGTLDSFSGDFVVPSYRGSSFLDPKVSKLLTQTLQLCLTMLNQAYKPQSFLTKTLWQPMWSSIEAQTMA